MPLSQNHTAIAKLLIEKGAKLDEKSYVSKDGVSDKNILKFFSDNDVDAALLILKSSPDMRFVQNFTLPDFQAKTFTPAISAINFNSFSDKNTKNE